jgi:uncharacterized phage infection (PIP) family protein YhgE
MDKANLRRSWSARRTILVIAGAAAIALLPIAASASSSDSGGLDALVQTVQALTGQTNRNTSDIATLKAEVAQLQADNAAQAAEIQALQNSSGGGTDDETAVLNEANAYTDTRFNQVSAAIQTAAAANPTDPFAIAMLGQFGG